MEHECSRDGYKVSGVGGDVTAAAVIADNDLEAATRVERRTGGGVLGSLVMDDFPVDGEGAAKLQEEAAYTRFTRVIEDI